MLDISCLSNAEILHRDSLDNKVLVQIPRTPYHLLMEKDKDGLWAATALELGTYKRKRVRNKMSAYAASSLVSKAISSKDQAFKHHLKFKEFCKELEILINNININLCQS